MFRRARAGAVLGALVAASLVWPSASTMAGPSFDVIDSGKTQRAENPKRNSDAKGIIAPFVPGEIIVAFAPNVGSSRREEIRRVTGAQSTVPLSPLSPNSEVFSLGQGTTVERALEALRNAPGVRYAEPNYIVESMETSNDPEYTSGRLWGMLGATTSPVNAFGSRAGEAWTKGFIGSRNVVVGVIDEGIDVTHPDLRKNIWINPGEIAGNGIDDDGNGYVDDIHGFDFVNNDGSVLDSVNDQHGTHVAGTIGAEGGNGIGVAGVNWNVSMISAKFLQGGSGNTTNAIRAVDYITSLKIKYGLNIVATSNSWGGGGYSQSLLEAIDRGGDQGILFIAAAGNSSNNNDTGLYFPSGYLCTKGDTRDFDCVISVASTTSTGGLSSFSSYGLSTVDIAAPGSDIRSTIPGNSYSNKSGTSMATPHVSGAAALCAAAAPGTSARDLRAALVESTRTTDSLAGKTANSGRLDVRALLKRCTSAGLEMTGSPSGLTPTAVGHSQMRLDWIDSTSDESGYQVQVADFVSGSCLGFSTVGRIGADNTRFYVTGLKAATHYCFRVGATVGSSVRWSDISESSTQSFPAQYICEGTSYLWQSPPSGAATHTLTDDSSVTVSIPFTFNFYGVPVSSVQISSNGFLRFESGPAWEYWHSRIPATSEPNAIAAPWWLDFNPARGGQIRSHVLGTAPNRRFIISWLDLLPYAGTATNGASFQAILNESGSTITYQYRDTLVGTATIDRGATGSVGIEGSGGEFGTQISFNSGSLADSSALLCRLPGPPRITSSSFPGGILGLAYNETVQTAEGSGNLTLSVDSGSLPAGMAIDGMNIVGTPTATGTSMFTLRVTDQTGATGTKSLQIVVAEPVVVSTPSLTAATVGSSYSQTLSGSGGFTPYSWHVVSGSLPAGLSLSSTGVISGTPSSSAKNQEFVVRMTDSAGYWTTHALSIRVNVVVTTTSLTSATQGVVYSQTLSSVGGAPGVAHAWQVVSGTLPDGLSLSSTGVIGGTPTSSAVTSTATIMATDGGVEGTHSRSLTLTVVEPLIITTSSLPNGSIGIFYSATLSSSGATGSTTWALASGSLPAGLSLSSSTGDISGTPNSKAKSSTFTIRITDSTGRVASASLTISIVEPTAPAAFGKSSPKNGATRVNRSTTLSWGSSARADRFEYCYDTTNNNVCDSGVWTSAGTSLSAAVSLPLARTTYYWHVRAVNISTGEITYSNTDIWWRFTTG